MNAEPQAVFEMEFCYPTDYAVASENDFPTVQVAEQTKASALNLATMLECFWMFYEAMRSGKPLPNAEERLSNLGHAMRMALKRT